MLTEQWPCCFLFFSNPFLPPMHFHGLPLILTCLEVGSVFSRPGPSPFTLQMTTATWWPYREKTGQLPPKNLCEGKNFYGITFGLASMASKERNPWTEITVWDPYILFLGPILPPPQDTESIHQLLQAEEFT